MIASTEAVRAARERAEHALDDEYDQTTGSAKMSQRLGSK